MRQYPEYKHSGEDALGSIPEHWDVVPLKRVADTTLGKMLAKTEKEGHQLKPYLRSKSVQWERVDVSDVKEMWFSEKEMEQCRLHEGDIVVSEGGEVGRAALWRGELDECYIQNSVHKVTVRSGYDPRYFLYHFVVYGKGGFFDAAVDRVSIAHLTQEKLREIPVALPPPDEQRQLAAYLDRKTADVDTLIGQKQALIARLGELRAALIHRAVTKGLDADVPMKDSGVEWLGEVPEHWTSPKIKFIAQVESGHTPSRQHPEYWENCTTPWFTLADVWQLRNQRTTVVAETKAKVSELGLANSSARLLPAGTVILSRTASVGFSGVLGVDMATSQDFVCWICGPTVRPMYLLFALRAMKEEFRSLLMGSTHKTIYMPDAYEFVTPLPPLEEQDAIVSHIEQGTRRLDDLIDKETATVALLRELRTSLISEVVTGKVDVRAEAPEPAAA